jgi:peptide/nickel transport system ATP-binding protein
VTSDLGGSLGAGSLGAPSATLANERLLTVRDLSVSFGTDDGVVRAVRHVSFEIDRREVLGVVGESGSGKSVSSMAVMGLLPRTATITGSINFDGRELVGLSYNEMRGVRGNGIAMIFQDPMTSLNPVFTVGWQLAEAYRAHHDVSKRAARAKSVETLDLVGIPQPDRRAQQYPHEFSGGMRQRAMIAMSIINDPDLIIADEPTTALDVTVQAQILETLLRIRDETSSAIMIITHDLGVVAGMVDRVQVMYGGTIVESGVVHEVFDVPRMPYTVGLLGSIPHVGLVGKRLTPIKGAPPSLMNLPTGCSFSPRCPLAIDVCRETEPALMDTDRPVHLSRCHRWKELASLDNPQSLFAHEEIGTIEDAAVFQIANPDETSVVDEIVGTQQPAEAGPVKISADADKADTVGPSAADSAAGAGARDFTPGVDVPGVDAPASAEEKSKS